MAEPILWNFMLSPAEKKRATMEQANKESLLRLSTDEAIRRDRAQADLARSSAIRDVDFADTSANVRRLENRRNLQQDLADVNVAEGRYRDDPSLSPEQNRNMAMIEASTDVARIQAAPALSQASSAMQEFRIAEAAKPYLAALGAGRAQGELANIDANMATSALSGEQARAALPGAAAAVMDEQDTAKIAREALRQENIARARVAPTTIAPAIEENRYRQAQAERGANLQTELGREDVFSKDIQLEIAKMEAQQKAFEEAKAASELAKRFPGLSPNIRPVSPMDLQQMRYKNPGMPNITGELFPTSAVAPGVQGNPLNLPPRPFRRIGEPVR